MSFKKPPGTGKISTGPPVICTIPCCSAVAPNDEKIDVGEREAWKGRRAEEDDGYGYVEVAPLV